jgi:Sec-independent protein translocase protein TatA
VGDIFQPWHLIVVAVLIAFVVSVAKLIAFAGSLAKKGKNTVNTAGTPSPSTELSAEKFCTECGGKIMRRAEICPLCGCRVA